MAVESHDELDVFSDSADRVAAGRLDEVAPEEAERAGDDEERSHPAPADPADEEGAEVLNDLKGSEPRPGQANVDDAPVLDAAPICDSDDAARRDHEIGIVENRLGDPQQGVVLEHGIGVDCAEIRVAGAVDRTVERVGLTAVVLVDHPELWM